MRIQLPNGAVAYDPRGIVEASAQPLAQRLSSLDGARIAILDNTKWNGSKLLRETVSLLKEAHPNTIFNLYEKESFSSVAEPGILDTIAAENDGAITAIGD